MCRLHFAAQPTSLPPPRYEKTNTILWKESALRTMRPVRARILSIPENVRDLVILLASLINTPMNSISYREKYMTMLKIDFTMDKQC